MGFEKLRLKDSIYPFPSFEWQDFICNWSWDLFFYLVFILLCEIRGVWLYPRIAIGLTVILMFGLEREEEKYPQLVFFPILHLSGSLGWVITSFLCLCNVSGAFACTPEAQLAWMSYWCLGGNGEKNSIPLNGFCRFLSAPIIWFEWMTFKCWWTCRQ